MRRRFTGATDQQIAAAANAIMGLDEEWEELSNQNQVLASPCGSSDYRDICYLAQEFKRGAELRVLRRVSSAG